MHAKLAAFIILLVILAQCENGISAKWWDDDDDDDYDNYDVDDDGDNHNDDDEDDDDTVFRFEDWIKDDWVDRKSKGYRRRGRDEHDDDDDSKGDSERKRFEITFRAFTNFKTAQKKSGLSCAKCKAATKMILDNFDIIEPEMNKVKGQDKIAKSKHLCNMADKFEKGRLLVDANMTKQECLDEMPHFLHFWKDLKKASSSIRYKLTPSNVINRACGPKYANICSLFGGDQN